MKIAYVLDQVLPCTETDTEQALNTVSALARQGAEVTLFLPAHAWRACASADALRDYYQVEGDFELRRLRALVPSHRALEKPSFALRTALSRELGGFDVVYTRNLPTVVSHLAAGRRVLYETYRAWPRQMPWTAAVFRRVLNHPRLVGAVFHSRFAQASYLALGVSAEKTLVAHNGYDPKRFRPALTKQEARLSLGLSLEGELAVYAGRISVQKGLALVLEMARARPSCRFLLIGSEREGEIERQAKGLSNVQVLPWKSYDELPAYLFAADVLILPPSLGPLEKVGNTVLPMKLFLYMAAGRAIFAPEAPDTAELLVHDQTAWLVKPDDAALASASFGRLLDDPARLVRLGEVAAARAEDLTWDGRAREILSFVERRLAAAVS